MLDQLPNTAEVENQIKEVKDARAALAKAKDDIHATEQKLAAQREKADTVNRMAKAQFDSKMSYLNLAVEKYGRATDPAGTTIQKEIDQRRQQIEGPGGLGAQLADAAQ